MKAIARAPPSTAQRAARSTAGDAQNESRSELPPSTAQRLRGGRQGTAGRLGRRLLRRGPSSPSGWVIEEEAAPNGGGVEFVRDGHAAEISVDDQKECV